MFALVFVPFIAVAFATGAAAGCADVPAATTTWVTTCTNLTGLADAACWSHGLPVAASTVVFPAGTNATMASWHSDTAAVPYKVLFATNVVIEAGATVTMQGDGMQITNCLRVEGSLVLQSDSNPGVQWSQVPDSTYLPDPQQPLGTDCSTVPIGFTPRLCGPGKLEVSGVLVLQGLYSSLFMSGEILQSGTLNISHQAFVWGNLTNYGTVQPNAVQQYTFVSSVGPGDFDYYAYLHGYFYNYGTADLPQIAFDRWATTFIANTGNPLLIVNHGTLTIGGQGSYPTRSWYPADGTQGTYRALVVNYATLVFSTWLGTHGFDVMNTGTVAWNGGGWYGYMYVGEGTYYNRGVFRANDVAVSFLAYIDEGGALETVNGGTFTLNTGNANALARATMHMCELVSNMPSVLMQRYRDNRRAREVAARAVVASALVETPVTFRDGVWFYDGWAYAQPYEVALVAPGAARPVFTEPELPAVDASGLPLSRHRGDVKLIIQQVLADDIAPTEMCHAVHSFAGTTIRGDGTGSVMATAPVHVSGTVTVANGGKWYFATEHAQPPVFGGGKLEVANGGALFVGIDADFKYDGSVAVQRGGMLAVPKHAKVAFSNHSLSVASGAKLHVDGQLTLAARKGGRVRVEQCGVVDGVGRIEMAEAGVLGCPDDAAREPVARIRQLRARKSPDPSRR